MKITLEQLQTMNAKQLFDVMQQGGALDTGALADTTYTGIDLSMPSWFHKLAWKSFRKTFHRDPDSDALRGWNVKVEQTGWDIPPEPKRDNKGRPLTFGHYEVRSAEGIEFPRGWSGGHYLDYKVAGNLLSDFPARAGYCPLVEVNPGDPELLLGWEVFKLGPMMVPIPDFWVLKREGALDASDVQPVPRPVG